MKAAWIFAIAASALLAGCSTPYNISPVADASQQVRYDHGKPTTYSEKSRGAVQVTPLGVNADNRLGFSIAVFNKSDNPADFGVENLAVLQQDGTPDKVMTSVELEHEAEVKAAWAQVAMVVIGGLDAYEAGRHSYSTTNAVVRTPYGSAAIHARTYDAAAAYQTGHDIGVATGADIASIQSSLDTTLQSIGQNVLQTTTVDPGDATAGIAVVDALSSSSFPQDVVLHVNWNGEDHVFHFTVAKGEEAVVRQISHPAAPPTQVASTTLPSVTPAAPPAASVAPVPQQTFASYDRTAVQNQAVGRSKSPREGIAISGAAY